MTGLPDFNAPAYEAAAADLLARGYATHNPAANGVLPGWTWADYMREDLRHLLDCHQVAVLPGWRQSRGAVVGVYIAEQLGLPVLEYPDMKPISETVCQEADRLVSGDRGQSYGHPFDNFTHTGRLWAPILGLDEVTPEQVALCMVQLKVSRECFKSKRDNRVDGAGYLKCLDLVVKERARRAQMAARTTPPPRPSA